MQEHAFGIQIFKKYKNISKNTVIIDRIKKKQLLLLIIA